MIFKIEVKKDEFGVLEESGFITPEITYALGVTAAMYCDAQEDFLIITAKQIVNALLHEIPLELLEKECKYRRGIEQVDPTGYKELSRIAELAIIVPQDWVEKRKELKSKEVVKP